MSLAILRDFSKCVALDPAPILGCLWWQVPLSLLGHHQRDGSQEQPLARCSGWGLRSGQTRFVPLVELDRFEQLSQARQKEA